MSVQRQFGKCLSVVLLLGLVAPEASAQEATSPERIDLGAALKSSQEINRRIRRYPEYVKPGEKAVVQRTPFDFSNARRNIQIALVIDGTNSMGLDIAGLKDSLRTFIDGLRERVAGSRKSAVTVEVALIVYRDFLSPSGPVQILTAGIPTGFTEFSDPKLYQLLGSIQTEDGTPSMPEQVDRGVYAALTGLDWNMDDQVTRVVILAGDAPPWEDEYLNEATSNAFKAKYRGLDRIGTTFRGHSTDSLIALAREKGITIYSILCNSGFVGRENDPIVARAVAVFRPRSRRFLGRLANETGGALLDLSNRATVRTLVQATGGDVGEFVQLKSISAEDLERRKRDGQVRVAVLPPQPLNQMDFTSSDGYLAAADIVLRLQKIGGSSVETMRVVQQEWNRLTYETPPNEKLIPQLASAFGVDFLIWGDYRAQDGTVQVSLRAYDRDGTLAVLGARAVANNPEVATAQALANLVDAMAQAGQAGNQKAAAFARIHAEPDVKNRLTTQFASNNAAYQALIRGYDLLERATRYEAGSDEGRQFTATAVESLKESLRADPGNPFVLLLLSNCHYNLGETDAAAATLKQAYDARGQTDDPQLKLEIEADYALFVEKDPLKAISLYRQLAENAHALQPAAALRANWMLAGLYLGDWGAAPRVQSLFESESARLDAARDRILDILVYWPDSPEAGYYNQFVSPSIRPVSAGPSRIAQVQPRHHVQHDIVIPVASRTKLAQAAFSE